MRLEYCWFALGVTGILSQIGGSGHKWARRFLIPITLAGLYWYFVSFSWLLIPYLVLQWASFTLPVTLMGDGIPKHWQNWLWLPVKYVLVSMPAVILALNLWAIPLVLGGIMAGLVALSNIPATAKYFQWKAIEFGHGVAPAIVMCYVITI